MRRLPNGSACALLVSLVWIGCVDKSKDLDLTGRVGEPCRSCNDCDTHLSREGCACQTCVPAGYDPDAKLLLKCEGAVWEKDLECPGGVSVECDPSGSFVIHCFDQNGNELWRPD